MHKKKKIIGLTGGIGSGKTSAANYLESLGTYIVDADLVARNVVKPTGSAYSAIRDLLGINYFNSDQTLNRAKVRTLIFNSSDIRSSYESIILPKIRKEIITMIQNPPKSCCYVLLVAPLLFEKGLSEKVDLSIVIDVDENTQIKRVLARDKTSDSSSVQNIINTQFSREKRNSLANYVISNQSDLAHLKTQLDKIHRIIIQ